MMDSDMRHTTFSLCGHLVQCFFGDRFHASRKGVTEGGRWVYLKGANSMATSGLNC